MWKCYQWLVNLIMSTIISVKLSDQGTELEMNKSSDSMPVPSLLSVLRVPKLSDLTRKRKVQCNSGKHKKVCSSSSTSSEPKGVTPQDWVKKSLMSS